ncbi:Hypothetical Protein FCC1311_038922 [Hondaea fermentalgiana]|uniref:Uncharacterized protein n=1 Tax=Hondaea fermentalgiana TaxID=2315210 RepID=A0A2R5GBF1_9STRA|nr:Hypothetical Protein FCC1311_038922 [Hondaea fermentalgiana]|eukprot:GBG27669.1 Hypothetical Protein FCC1311_038922 [Hondaea fermentalgiana]
MAVLTALWLQHCRQLIVCRASQECIVLAAGAWDLGPGSSGGSGGEDDHVADQDQWSAPNRTLTWCQELTSSAQGRSPVRALWPGPQLATDNGSPEASLVVEYDDGTLVVFTVSSGGTVREISKVELAMAEGTILNIAHVLLCDHETLVLTAQVGRDQSSSYSVFIVDLATGQAQPCDGQEDLLAEADCGTCSSFACYARCLRSGQVSVAMSDSPGIAMREEIAAGFTGMLESACPEIALLHRDKSMTRGCEHTVEPLDALCNFLKLCCTRYWVSRNLAPPKYVWDTTPFRLTYVGAKRAAVELLELLILPLKL